MSKRYIVGAIVAALVVVGVLVGLSLSGGGEETPKDVADAAAQAKRELDGIPRAGNVLGEESAPVTIVEYGDITCPACKQFNNNVVPELITRYVRTGAVKMDFRPIRLINNPSSERGAFGAAAAARQDALWPFVSAAYRIQGPEDEDWFGDSRMRDLVKALGIDSGRWRTDFDNTDLVLGAVTGFETQAGADKVTGTPTLVVTGPRGTRDHVGGRFVPDVEQMVAAIEAVGPAS